MSERAPVPARLPTAQELAERARWFAALPPAVVARLPEMTMREIDTMFARWRALEQGSGQEA